MTDELQLQIKHKVLEMVGRDQVLSAGLGDNDPLVTSGILGSLRIVELATWMEQEFGLNFGKIGFNIYDFETISDMVRLVAMNRQGNCS